MIESKLTRYLKTLLLERLEPELRRMGFIPPSEEKFLVGKRFDIYAYDRKRGRFSVWEIEIRSSNFPENIRKLGEILIFHWNPKVFMFHILSPLYTSSERKMCHELVEGLKKEFPRRLIYEQISLDIPIERFGRIFNAFISNRYQAKQYYGAELSKIVGRIAKVCLNRL